MVRKTVPFNQGGASKLPNNKPVVYRIQTGSGKTNYVGVAKKGRVQERIEEHLEEGKVSGSKVQIKQMPSIREAEKAEVRIIARSEPKYNKKGK